MKIKKIAGFLLIAIGIFIIIIQPFSTTGAVIDLSSSLSRIWFFVGLGLMGVGIAIMLADVKKEQQGGLEKTLSSGQEKILSILRENLKSGRLGTSKDLIRYAENLGYALDPSKGSSYKVFYPNGKPVIGLKGRQVEIHNHPGDMRTGTYRAITKDLVANVDNLYKK